MTQPTPTTQISAKGLAVEAARLLSDLKCEDVVVLDVRGQSQVTDFLVIGTGTSDRQMRSVGDDVAEVGDELGHAVFRSNCDRSSNWIIVDFVDVTVHIFEPNVRAFYDIEHLWEESRRVPWPRSESPGNKGSHGDV